MKNLETIIKISGMGSAHCAGRVKNALESLSSVQEAITDFEKGTAIVKYDGDNASTKDLEKTIEDAGYKVL